MLLMFFVSFLARFFVGMILSMPFGACWGSGKFFIMVLFDVPGWVAKYISAIVPSRF